MDIENSLADDILNIPYIDSDNMDEYLKNLADRARKLEIKRLLNMRYGAPQVNIVDVTDIPSEKIQANTNLISIEVKEDVDNFIFDSIKPWCEERIQRKICKADLEQALLMFYSLDKVDPESTVFNNEKR